MNYDGSRSIGLRAECCDHETDASLATSVSQPHVKTSSVQ